MNIDVIYKHTELEQTCRVNFEVLDGINPMRMSYKSYLLSFIEFRKLTKFRLYCNKLQAIQTKIHERETYIKVLQSGEIDNIINMIKNQSNIDDTYLVEYLIKKLKITDLQAKFILGTDIRKLSKGYLKKYIEEAKELEIAKQDCLRRITDDSLIIEDIKRELLAYKKLYGRKRRCKVITESEASDVPQGEFKIVVTQNNYIKKVQLNDSIGNSKNDNPKCVLKAENTENILIFDEMGKVFRLPVSKVMFTDRGSNGTDIRLMIKNLTSNINTIMYEPTVKDFSIKTTKYFIVVVTAQGNIKKMDLDDFLAVPPSGILYIKLDNGDYVKDIMITNDMNDVIVYSHSKALRMSVKDIPHLKRSTKGSRAMNTAEPIDGISIIKSNTTDIIVVTEKGYINRFHPAALPCMGRGKTGNRVIKLSKGDAIKAIYGLNENDSFMVITKNDKIEYKVSDITEGSSISPGTKMISTKNDMIVDIKILKRN